MECRLANCRRGRAAVTQNELPDKTARIPDKETLCSLAQDLARGLELGSNRHATETAHRSHTD